MTDECKHLSEFNRICILPKGHDGYHRNAGGVKWPSRPWGWSHDREEYAQ